MLRKKAFRPEDEFKDLGFGSRISEQQGRRLLNRDGTFSIARHRRTAIRALTSYHALLTMPWWKFHVLVFTGFVAINTVFALLYSMLGADAIHGADATSLLSLFLDSFFFSVQTFTTVGYGHIAPYGIAGNVLASLDVFVGLLSFAIATGLVFARFSRPVAQVSFSDRAVIAPYRGISAFEFRIANRRDSELIEVEVKILFSYFVETDNGRRRRFDQLTLERTKVAFFPLAWTVVHPITEDSPLAGMTAQDLADADAEFLVLITGIDETFSQTVHARSSYRHDELVWNARFRDMYSVMPDSRMGVNMELLHAYDVLPETEPLPER